MVDHKFPPAFPLKHQEKDLRLAIELGWVRCSSCMVV